LFTRSQFKKSLPILLLILLLFAVAGVHVFIQRLYELRLHVALGYGAVYAKNMRFELFSRYIGAFVFALVGWWSIRPYRKAIRPLFYGLLRNAAMLAWYFIGYGVCSLNATAWFLFVHHQPFHIVDPLLHMDDAFYAYQLPLLQGVVGRFILVLILFSIPRIVYVVLLMEQQRQITKDFTLRREILRHTRMAFIGVAIFTLALTILSVLGRYALLQSAGNGSFIFGPDFVTARLTLPIFTWLHIAALLLVTATFLWIARHTDRVLTDQDGFLVFAPRWYKRPAQAIGVYIGSMLLTALTAALVNGLYVRPNQNTVEIPYIEHTITATRYGLGIEQLRTQPFAPATSLTAGALQADTNAIQNIRVNDLGQTATIYNQLQSFKSYFHFDAASVDRYGNQEVYTSARQMDVDNLPVQTYVNRTFVYTHGYGIAASPVNTVDDNGLPVLLAKDTPQVTLAPLPTVTRPQIYFGTMTNNVVAPSRQAEFDYPAGSTDASSHYQGGFGLPIQGNRLLLAIEQGTLKFYTSDQILPQSQFLFDRNIYKRVADIAPFLTYDQDAFPFINQDGHILWMLDAYTEAPNLPYAEPFMSAGYIRNSVKVVMDAYTGQVTFYVVNSADPMLKSLMQAYPTLFTTQVPKSIAAHFRYPQDLFQAQAQALTRYHMTDPAAFYNQEDLWAMANQIYQQQSTPTARPPVYQMIRMPGQSTPQFVVSALFTPANKDNLNGWLIANSEPDHYGELNLYQFPQSSLIFGPMQAENQIDANPSISSQLTLWNQQGSQVVRGDLLLIPIGDALVYVEPVYLVASRQNSLPQLERVIVYFNQQVFIDTSLDAALKDMLQGIAAGRAGTTTGAGAGGAPATGGQGSTVGTTTGVPNRGTTPAELAAAGQQWLQKYEADTAKGNFEAAGVDLKQLGTILNQLATAAKTTK